MGFVQCEEMPGEHDLELAGGKALSSAGTLKYNTGGLL